MKTSPIIWGMVFVFCLLCPVLPAQTSTEPPTITDVNQRIDDLEKQITALRAELAAQKQAAAPATTSNAPVTGNAATATATTATPAPAPAPLEGIASVLRGSTVTGLVDTFYSYNINQPVNRSSQFRLFDAATNQFSLNLVELGLVKTPDASTSRLGYNITFGFGNAMNVVNSTDPAGLGFAQYLKEAYGSYLFPVGKGLQMDFGKFVTPNGAEVIESNANWNYSRSLLFNFAIPFYHFGLRTKYAFNDKVAVTGYVVNGWNNLVENYSSGKTGGLSFVWNPTKKWSFTENWMGGPGATPADANSWRNLSDTVITYSPTSKLSLMANGDYGRSERPTAAGFNHSVDWSGVAGYVKYQVNPLYAFATRYEYYDDPDGFTTGGFSPINGATGTCFANSATCAFSGTPQHIHEVTGTVERRIAQHLITRLEFRHDISNQHSFLKSSRPVTGQSTVAAGLIYVLEPDR